MCDGPLKIFWPRVPQSLNPALVMMELTETKSLELYLKPLHIPWSFISLYIYMSVRPIVIFIALINVYCL